MLNSDERTFQTSHKGIHDKGVRLVKFATSKNLIFESIAVPCLDKHKYTWTTSDRLMHNQIDCILTSKRRHSGMNDVHINREATILISETRKNLKNKMRDF
jgi:hypothetical protein